MSEHFGFTSGQLDELWDRVRPDGRHDRERDDEVLARVVWSVLSEPGDGVVGRLVDDLGAAPALQLVLRREPPMTAAGLRHDAHMVAGAVRNRYEAMGRDAPDGVRAGFLRWQPRMTGPLVAGVLKMAAVSGATLLTPADPEWPAGFADLGDHAPLLLWCRGGLGQLDHLDRSIAMVGTRAATGYGTHVTTELAADLAELGWTVVSGGAYGIDAAAHRAALAAGGRTISVMAGGIETFYPAGNRELLVRVARDGLVVAEVLFGTPPTAFRFLARNRLIAAMTTATVVVEAGLRSGLINTVNHAGAIGRPIGAVPGPVTSASSAGCHYVLRERPSRCVTSAREVVELANGEDAAIDPLADPADPRYGRVTAALSVRSARTVAEIAARSGLAAQETAALLSVLLLDGRVRKTEAGWVSVPAPA